MKRKAGKRNTLVVMPYKLEQKLLLVGEGNFSFTAALADKLGSARDIVVSEVVVEGCAVQCYLLCHVGDVGAGRCAAAEEGGCGVLVRGARCDKLTEVVGVGLFVVGDHLPSASSLQIHLTRRLHIVRIYRPPLLTTRTLLRKR
jgi:hypothetical protein